MLVMRPGSIRTAPRDHGATAPAPAIQHPPLTNPWKLLSVLPLVVLQRPKRRKVLLKAYNGREVDSPNGLGVEATQKLEKLQTLTGETAEIQAEAIFHLFSFELDPVQREAALELSRGKDVMCCLPTGSGKTAIAVFAAWQVLMRGGKFIYTSPLKALSAQKRREFAQIFGPEAVGLVTGDHCVIPDAPLVVMTTEILRNKLYPGNSSLTHTPMPIIVVLDELHWISDPARGRAWEEVIINGPSWIQFLSLSGSVGGDPQEFCDWMTSARSRVCSLVVSQVRPVPLHFYMMMRSSKDPQRQRCFRLWDEAEVPLEESQIHPKLHAQSAWSDVREGGTNAAGMDRVIALSKTLRRLQSLGWLPSLSFALRRRQCEKQVKVAFMMICLGGLGGAPSNGPIPPFPKQLRLPKRLVSSAERKQIQSAINVFEEQFPDLKLSDITKTVMMAGLASHHAGQMPAQRALVECLFERGLVKMIFATETLAAGIHMPARSVIITALQKKDAFGLRCLNGTEVLQMSGRAGRRGLDQSGHAIVHGPVIWTMDTLKSGPLPLSSSFSPSYDMLCALFTGGKSEQDVAQLVEKSFAAFLADDLPDQESRELEYHRYGELLARVRDVLERSGCTVQDVKEYKKLKDQHDMDSRLCFAGHSDDDLDLFLDDALPQLDDGLGDTIDSHDLDRNKVHQLKNKDELLGAIEERSALANVLRSIRPARDAEMHRWPSFQKYISVLEQEGFLRSEDAAQGRTLRSTLKGEAAHRITQGANILWLSCLLPQPLGPDLATRYCLSPADLAALVAAMTADSLANQDAETTELSAELTEVIDWLIEYRWHLWEVQLCNGVVEAMPLSVKAFRVTKAWASGEAWQEVVASAAMAEGDVFRLMRRTLEILEGLEFCTADCASEWKLRVQEAQEMLLRCPVEENQEVEAGEFELPLDASA